MAKKRFAFWTGILLLLMVGTASWALYGLINEGASDLLTNYGIDNIYAQYGIVIGIVLIILLFLGYRVKKSIKKIV